MSDMDILTRWLLALRFFIARIKAKRTTLIEPKALLVERISSHPLHPSLLAYRSNPGLYQTISIPMKNFILLVLLLSANRLLSQTIYSSTHYATVGDTFFLTKAQVSPLDYDTTGEGISWNYGSLTGTSQSRWIFRAPSQTGYSALTWPFIFNSNNTNLSATNGESVEISAAGLILTNPNAYFKKSTSDLRQVASGYKLAYNNVSLAIKNQFTSPDILYRFPLMYGNSDSSTASFVTEIPATYYQAKTLKRKNQVDGWGQVITPFGTFSNTLRVVSTVQEADSFALLGVGLPKITRHYRELKWLDISQKYPVLFVTQTQVGNQWVTSSVEYLDEEHFFQPVALFGYTPTQPVQGNPVYFQNVSTNATTYSWEFGDAGSGPSNTSTDQNPEHTFTSPGTFPVKLIAINDQFQDTVTIPVVVFSDTVPSADFLFISSPENCLEFQFTNSSTGAQAYVWNFGDTSSAINSSVSENPVKRFSGFGSFAVRLIASNGSLKDTVVKMVTVQGNLLPQVAIAASANPVQEGHSITFSATVLNEGNTPIYQWLVNGISMGSNSNVFELPNPTQGQTVQCVLSSSLSCANPTQVTSNSITVEISGATSDVAKPEILPGTGNYTDPLQVSITCETPGAIIYYTTSGNLPVVGTSYTKMYTAPFMMLESGTIRAMAIRSGLADSPVAVSYLTITNPGICSAPVFTPTSGSYEGSATVIMSTATNGGEIWYTTNGMLPRFDVTNTFTKRYAGPFVIYGNTPIKAVTTKAGLANSLYSSATYTIANPSIVAAPIMSPLPGSFGGPLSITLSTSTQDAQIYYTTNGNIPRLDVPNSYTKLYINPFTLSQSATIRAIGVKTNWQSSATSTGVYSIGALKRIIASELEVSASNSLYVYPNPSTTGIFELVVPENGTESWDFSVWTSDGKEVLTGEVSLGGRQTLDLEQLPSGMYLLKIRSADGFEARRLTKL